jgi:thiol-disulfide isomerase/thioredoxin
MRRIAIAGLLAMILVGLVGSLQRTEAAPNPDDTPPAYRSLLPDFGEAPELLGKSWLNTDQPLRLAALRGQVVLLEFWTFGCINCVHTLPYVQEWYAKYQSKGLTVIGDHFPEFGYERDIQNIAAALKERGITYPIVQDNEGATWNAYQQRFWPTMYLIDKAGHIRYRAIGEGGYEITENVINELLKETYKPDAKAEVVRDPYLTPVKTVRVYRKPSTESEVLGSVNPQMAFVVLDTRDGWHRIPYNDGDGYIPADAAQISFVAPTAKP